LQLHLFTPRFSQCEASANFKSQLF